MSSQQVRHSLAAFVAETDRALRSERGLDAKLERVAAALGTLLQDRDLLSGELALPRRAVWESYLLYEHPELGYVVTALIHPPGWVGPPHEHGPTWTVYGVCEGEEVIRRYARLDDGAREGYAELRETRAIVAGAGTVDWVRPGEIHSENNPGADPSVAIVVRSQNLGSVPQHLFDLQRRSVTRIYGRPALPLRKPEAHPERAGRA